MMYFKRDIEELFLAVVNKFWDYKRFDESSKNAAERYFKIVKFLQSLHPLGTFGIVCLFFLRPTFNSTYILPMYSAVPDSFKLDTVLMFVQFYCLCVGVIVVPSCDLIYLVLCMHLILQVKFLKKKFLHAIIHYTKGTKREVEYCLNYHQFLLS